MKKLTLLLLCIAAVAALTACAGKQSKEEPLMQIPNPFVDYDSLEAAAKAAGFELKAPSSVEGFSEKVIQVCNGEMIQVIFLNGDDRLFIRKAEGSDDISGDYNEYSDNGTVTVDGNSVTLRGDDGKVSTAVWTSGKYTYSVSFDTPVTEETMIALIGQIG
ncbi:MAG: hypothetical protein J6Z24_08310 [Oscillospiraceae bacterium]|jgi:outer membrane lipoprotein-sorting protein|nr:hypothetical protein [Oscillospiraceae bacterium]